jgi:actin-related protein 2
MNSDILILDNGSGYLKCGLSSKERPLVTIPSLIGRPMLRYDEKIENFNIKVKINSIKFLINTN